MASCLVLASSLGAAEILAGRRQELFTFADSRWGAAIEAAENGSIWTSTSVSCGMRFRIAVFTRPPS